jgi:hypothetical protein
VVNLKNKLLLNQNQLLKKNKLNFKLLKKDVVSNVNNQINYIMNVKIVKLIYVKIVMNH